MDGKEEKREGVGVIQATVFKVRDETKTVKEPRVERED